MVDATSAQGRQATSPWRMSGADWFAVLKRTWGETNADNVGLIAAGVAFYGFLALVPLLGAIVLSYGLVAEPATVMDNMRQLTSVMPGQAAQVIGDQLMNVVTASDGKKGLGLLLALALALYGARNGAGALIIALNVAYEEEEKRGFVRLNLLTLGMTAAAVVVAILALLAVTAMGHLQTALPQAPGAVLILGKIAAYAVVTAVGAAGAATLYRFGPSREQAKWTWLTPGSLLAALLWLLLTIGFGIYVANFGNYNATYGSLGAVVVLLTWMYLSSYILVLGAELNSELEHQTAADTTVRNVPAGQRGAWVTDNLAGAPTKDEAATSAPMPAPAPVRRAPVATHSHPSSVADYAAGRVSARIVRHVGGARVGAVQSVLVTGGLSLLRRRGRTIEGAALLALGGGLAWWLREDRPQSGAVEVVLFDLDGTLVDSNGFHVQAWQAAFRERGIDLPADRIAEQIGKGGDLLVPSLLPDLPKREARQLDMRHGEIFKKRFLHRVRPFPGAADLVRRIAANGQKVALASSASTAELDHYVALLDIADVVYARTSSDDVSTSKPAGDIFTAALRKLKTAPAAARIVGDTPYDVIAGKRAGIAAVAVRSGGFLDETLNEAGAVAIYDGAQALVDDFAASPLSAGTAVERAPVTSVKPDRRTGMQGRNR